MKKLKTNIIPLVLVPDAIKNGWVLTIPTISLYYSHMSNQPNWKLVAQLGDVNPIEYGGYFIYEDTTGVYPPEAEVLIPEDEGKWEPDSWTIYRFTLEKCTYNKDTDTLSDNKFHPELCAWFAKREEERAERPQDTTYLKNICSYSGHTKEELIKLFCSENTIERAVAWKMVGDYHGLENLDSYPLNIKTREEIETRYKAQLKDLKNNS